MTLYHASQQQNLTLIKPQRTLSHDKYIGDFVFATQDVVLAAMYLVPKGFALLMNTNLNPPVLVIGGAEKDLRANEVGGAIYELSDEAFMPTPQSGLELYEKVSAGTVKPLKVRVYESIFDAFKEHNIVVKFVDNATFRQFAASPNQKVLIQEL